MHHKTASQSRLLICLKNSGREDIARKGKHILLKCVLIWTQHWLKKDLWFSLWDEYFSSALSPRKPHCLTAVLTGRQVGPVSPCREKLEKTIILFTKVVSSYFNNKLHCEKLWKSLTGSFNEIYYVYNIIFILSFPFLNPINSAARFPGAPPMCVYTTHPSFFGVCCQLRLHSCWGGSDLWTFHCTVHEPHQNDCKERYLQTCQEHWW